MKQGRETTQEERIQIAKDCIASGKNYGEMALKYQVSYQQVRTWTLRFEQMGAAVTWDDATQTATATVPVTTEEEIQTFGLAEEKSVTFSVDNTTATVNGSAATMDVPARLINDKTMVPLRFLSENLGFNVQWDEATRTAIVTTE